GFLSAILSLPLRKQQVDRKLALPTNQRPNADDSATMVEFADALHELANQFREDAQAAARPETGQFGLALPVEVDDCRREVPAFYHFCRRLEMYGHRSAVKPTLSLFPPVFLPVTRGPGTGEAVVSPVPGMGLSETGASMRKFSRLVRAAAVS